MTKINNPKNLSGKLFGYEIKYNQVEGSSAPHQNFPGLVVKPKFNGNIAEVDWKTATDGNGNLRRYGCVYDKLNRLSAGFYQKDTNPNLGEYFEHITYDVNGNIKTLQRSAGSTGTIATSIDLLTYNYKFNNQSNVLESVKDDSQNYSGYPFFAVPNNITYDGNGNMTSQKDKNIFGIEYNYLNLPTLVNSVVPGWMPIDGEGLLHSYKYKANGEKYAKRVDNISPYMQEFTEVDYLDGFQYQWKYTKMNTAQNPYDTGIVLKFVPTSEGYFDFERNKYIYNYSDHLGNTRLSYFHNGSSIEVLEESNYYPFGLKHEGYNGLAGNPSYQYKYNGKELQETGMYDYGARFYMPDIGRWGVVDPLSEKFFDFTSYNYVLNNPVKFVDKDGMDVYLLNEEGKFILAKNQKGDDLVYGYNSKTGAINDNNNDNKGDYKDGIRIKTKGLVNQLRFYRDGNKDDDKYGYGQYHQAIKEYSTQLEDDMFNLFHYAAYNAKNVEFSLIDFNLGGKRYLALQTYNSDAFSPGSGQIGIDVSTNAEYHNHPFKTKYEQDYTELNSMGSRGNGVYYGNSGGDYRNTVNYNVNFPNYVFFPKSTNLYNVTKTGINLIKKINNDSKNLKK
ncbi:RHS repeat-associated core domain-containing protein [Chryseobacterium sp. LC2016-27]|uniref:RHS repeat domain-containing protein n=1 Tax=Chryseobacterium sp. LC2016-27 TaxID=2897326 RepID=UPI001E2CAA0E|nr:RHS repeat-associated core domain-containing protein [Chryseobacterium sp. LC2016-27]MCD0457528.1 RHS repeat-associated core domain-containing protein [Chryseobacterium sp. LC2016-27]